MDMLSNNFNDLCEVSKIRFFVASDLKRANLNDLYDSYWLEMENRFLNASEKVKENLFEKFLIDYLTIQRNAVIPQKTAYLRSLLIFIKIFQSFRKKKLLLRISFVIQFTI